MQSPQTAQKPTQTRSTMPTPTLADILARNPANFADNTTTVCIRDVATGQDTGLSIKMYGQDSPSFKAAERKIQRDRLERLQRNPALRNQLPDPDDSAKIEAALIAVCVAGAFLNDAPADDFPTDKKEIEAFLIAQPWIREQLDKALSDRANFMKPSTTA